MRRWILVGGFVSALLAGGAHAQARETRIAGTQTSQFSTAATGDSTGGNTSDFGDGVSATGTRSANASQLGDNDAVVSQDGTANTSDPVAGSQVVGAASGDVKVQNSNNATDPMALSGWSEQVNEADLGLGPHAFAGAASASQIGDNLVDLDQTGTAASGNAVSGSQVTGIAGGGDHVIQNHNFADLALAISGDVFVDNAVFVEMGADATGDVRMDDQIGGNRLRVEQVGDTASGDALAGAQVSGVVARSAQVQKASASLDSLAETGWAETFTFATDASSQYATALTGDALAGTQVTGAVAEESVDVQKSSVSEDSFAISGDAVGSNIGGSVWGEQHTDARTGDAAAGAQVTGAAAREVTVQNTAESYFDTAWTGDAEAENIADSTGFLDQTAIAFTGDAMAGSQLTGVAASAATVQNANRAEEPWGLTGDAFAFNDAFVDTRLAELTQAIQAATGDAVAGSQVTMVLGGPAADLTIQIDNTVTGALATSGDVAEATNLAEAETGPSGDPMEQSIRDSVLSLVQVLDIASGDAVAGAQVTGTVVARTTP